MSKLKQIKTIEILNITFQKSKFFMIFLACLVFWIISLLLLNVPKIGGMAVVIILVIYFMPTLVAFDCMSLYKEDYNVPKLIHPNKFQILIINLFLGFTLIGWLFVLWWAFKPGIVEVEKIRYEQ